MKFLYDTDENKVNVFFDDGFLVLIFCFRYRHVFIMPLIGFIRIRNYNKQSTWLDLEGMPTYWNSIASSNLIIVASAIHMLQWPIKISVRENRCIAHSYNFFRFINLIQSIHLIFITFYIIDKMSSIGFLATIVCLSFIYVRVALGADCWSSKACIDVGTCAAKGGRSEKNLCSGANNIQCCSW